jgi:hypothetical protein
MIDRKYFGLPTNGVQRTGPRLPLSTSHKLYAVGRLTTNTDEK